MYLSQPPTDLLHTHNGAQMYSTKSLSNMVRDLELFFLYGSKTIYAIDYRKYRMMDLQRFCQQNDIDDVIVAPYMMATQSSLVESLFQPLYGV